MLLIQSFLVDFFLHAVGEKLNHGFTDENFISFYNTFCMKYLQMHVIYLKLYNSSFCHLYNQINYKKNQA